MADVPASEIERVEREHRGGISARQACRAALVGPLTDDPDLVVAITDIIDATL